LSWTGVAELLDGRMNFKWAFLFLLFSLKYKSKQTKLIHTLGLKLKCKLGYWKNLNKRPKRGETIQVNHPIVCFGNYSTNYHFSIGSVQNHGFASHGDLPGCVQPLCTVHILGQ
jgi:hypothetical protein